MPNIFNNSQQTKRPTSVGHHQLPTRKQSCIDLNMNTIITNSNNANTSLPPRMKKTMSNQSLRSTSTTTSASSNRKSNTDYYQQQKVSNATANNCTSRLRQPSPAVSHAKLLIRSDSSSSLHSTAMKRKSLTKSEKATATTSSSGDDDETKSCVTRSSSNGSIAASEKRNRRKNSVDRKKSRQNLTNDQATGGDNFVLDMLKDELEREKSSNRALLGQKEGIVQQYIKQTSMIL